MRSVGGMTFTLCPKEIKAGVGQYPVRINSVTDSVRSTSMWRWYGANKDLPLFDIPLTGYWQLPNSANELNRLKSTAKKDIYVRSGEAYRNHP